MFRNGGISLVGLMISHRVSACECGYLLKKKPVLRFDGVLEFRFVRF
jgi:hypothetical protein